LHPWSQSRRLLPSEHEAVTLRVQLPLHDQERARMPYMASPCGLEVALTDSLLSPCTRFSRARTTPEAPPLIQDDTGLGGLPGFAVPGAWIEVHMSEGGPRDAVGGRLYPWLHRTLPDSVARETCPWRAHPVAPPRRPGSRSEPSPRAGVDISTGASSTVFTLLDMSPDCSPWHLR